jgi:hypothetical protein
MPALLLLIAVGTGILVLGSHSPSTSARSIPPFFPPPATHALSDAASLQYAQLPMAFEPNQGQTDSQVRFMARGNGYGLFLTNKEAVLVLQRGVQKDTRRSVVRIGLEGAAANRVMEGTRLLAGRSNYLIGNDASKWHRDVPQYGRVRDPQVYPGIDMVYYGTQGQLEYDFEVAPGADPNKIALHFDGSKPLKLDGENLLVETADGTLRLQVPRIYQKTGAAESAVDGRFVLLTENTVGFEVGNYDHRQTLVIDPVLSYTTYFGGSGTESGPTIAVDAGFNTYVTGSTTSGDFPTAGTPFQAALHAGAVANVFVSKFDPTGTTLSWSTYLGGSGTDASVGIAVDAAGDTYVAGTTTSGDFPTSSSAFQAAPKAAGTHGFVSELDPVGQVLKYSTYLSGSLTDTMSGMTLDNKGLVYVIGITHSTDFPTAPSAGTLFAAMPTGASEAFFVSKLDPTTSGTNSLVFSTYFGGGNPSNGIVAGGGIAVDNNSTGSNIYITGGTNFLHAGQPSDFPISNAIQYTNPSGGLLSGGACLDSPGLTTCPTTGLPTTGGVVNMDAFIAKINPGTTTGAVLDYSTYVGGSGNDFANGIAVDASGNAYITGSTTSPTSTSANALFPPVSGGITAYQPCLNGPGVTPIASCTNADTSHTDAFVAKINNPVTGTGSVNLELVYWSFIGGTNNDVGNAIAVDGVGGARVVGTTFSSDLQLANAFQPALKGTQDAFVSRLDTVGTSTTSGTNTSQFVSYLGGSGAESATGIAVDTNTNSYITGVTTSSDFPPVSGVTPFQGSLKGAQDAFIAKLGPKLNFTIAPPGSLPAVNAGNQVTFSYTVTNTGDTTAGVVFLDNLGSGSGSAPATFVSASASGGTCPTTATNGTVLCNLGIMNGGSTSTVTVNLTPSGAGTLSNSGTIQVVGSSFSKTVSSPTVTVNSFTVAALPVTPIVVAGQPASYQITLTPNKTYTANISLSCSSGLPGGTPAPACTFSTTPVTLAGTSPSTVTLTISTTERTTTTVDARPMMHRFYAVWLPVAGFAFLGLGLKMRAPGKARVGGALLFLVLITILLLQPACGGHSSSTTTTGTPAGTYTVVITATSGTFSQTTPISLTVQ